MDQKNELDNGKTGACLLGVFGGNWAFGSVRGAFGGMCVCVGKGEVPYGGILIFVFQKLLSTTPFNFSTQETMEIHLTRSFSHRPPSCRRPIRIQASSLAHIWSPLPCLFFCPRRKGQSSSLFALALPSRSSSFLHFFKALFVRHFFLCLVFLPR